MVNASISGDTTSGGVARMDDLLTRHVPTVVIIELGGNDALRGLALSATRANLEKMVRAAQARNAQVLLLGMQMPPNYGADYGKRFAQMYAEIAREYKTALEPFFLQAFATDMSMFQADRIHPVAKAQTLMAQAVWPKLSPLLKR